MAVWQQMMKLSRLAGKGLCLIICLNSLIIDCEAEKRCMALQERRLAREKIIDESLHVWQRDILPNWKVVYKNARLRKLWWRGIPAKLRAHLWENVVGNELALSKGSLQLTDDRVLLLILLLLLLGIKIIIALACPEPIVHLHLVFSLKPF